MVYNEPVFQIQQRKVDPYHPCLESRIIFRASLRIHNAELTLFLLQYAMAMLRKIQYAA